MSSSNDVMIVGGGLAGLCCAIHLQDRGIPFRLFEGSRHLGGRVRTEEVDGFLLDEGFQVLLTAYPEAKQMLDFCQLDMRVFDPGALIRFQGRFSLLGDPFRRPGDAWASLRSPAGSLADKLKVARMRSRLGRTAIEALLDGPRQRTEDYLREQGFSSAIIERFFRPFLGGVFLDHALDTDADMFRFVFRMFAEGDVGVPAQGMQAIPAQLAARLPEDRLHLNAEVVDVTARALVLGNGTRVEGSQVVIATDQDSAGRLTGGPAARPWNGVTCMYFDAPAAPVERPILVLNAEGSGVINNLHVVSAVQPGAAPPGRALISVSVLGTNRANIESSVRAELGEWFGEVSSWRLLKTCTIPKALPRVDVPVDHGVRSVNGIVSCGDYLANASINGAMASGRAAAENVIAARTPV